MSGTRLDVHRCGGGDTRILLIHGSGSAAKPFLGLAEALIARLSESATDSEAVAVSLAGYGSTPADTHQPIVDQHLQVGVRAMEMLREMPDDRLHSRKLRSFDEAPFQ